jgi:hypothetical protein
MHLVELLLAFGADLNAKNEVGLQPRESCRCSLRVRYLAPFAFPLVVRVLLKTKHRTRRLLKFSLRCAGWRCCSHNCRKKRHTGGRVGPSLLWYRRACEK